jgi:class 3 adenylate cyclase
MGGVGSTLVQGSEREIAIMFVDIRGFTALSEGRLPYDVVLSGKCTKARLPLP